MIRVVHPLAEIEFKDARNWYRNIDPELAENFIEEVEEKAALILKNPLIFNLRKDQARRANLP